MPLGTSLPTFAAGVESMMNAWFKSEWSDSKGKYISEESFNEILKPELEEIGRKLNGKEKGDRVINKINYAFQASSADLFKMFFNEIGLEINDDEWGAINARHSIAHGGIDFESVEWKKISQNRVIYVNLIHKIILKLLGYSGDYIDRSVVPWNFNSKI